jgi:hypothetical protein
MVAVAKDTTTAEAWQRLVQAAGIEAEVRIGDPAVAGIPSPKWILGNYEPGTGPYSYPLYVQARDRRAARAVLARKAEFGVMKLDRTAVLGAFAVLGATMITIVVIVLTA